MHLNNTCTFDLDAHAQTERAHYKHKLWHSGPTRDIDVLHHPNHHHPRVTKTPEIQAITFTLNDSHDFIISRRIKVTDLNIPL